MKVGSVSNGFLLFVALWYGTICNASSTSFEVTETSSDEPDLLFNSSSSSIEDVHMDEGVF